MALAPRWSAAEARSRADQAERGGRPSSRGFDGVTLEYIRGDDRQCEDGAA